MIRYCAAGDSYVRTIHFHRIYRGFLAFWTRALQDFRVRQGYLHRSLRLHFNGTIRGQILRYRRSDEKAPRLGYELRFPIFPSF